MRKHIAYVVVMALIAAGLLPAAAAAQGGSRSGLPTGTFAALAERGDLEPGRKLLITFKLHQTGGYQQFKLKFVRITDEAIYVELNKEFEGLSTDLNLKFRDDYSDPVLPFSDPDWATLEIPERRVSRIAGIDSLANGALIGAAIGAGTMGVPMLAAGGCGSEYAEACLITVGITTAIGAGIGLGADAARVREGTVFYEAVVLTGPALTWKPVPLISKDRKGFMFVLTW